MASGVTQTLWNLEDVVKMADDYFICGDKNGR